MGLGEDDGGHLGNRVMDARDKGRIDRDGKGNRIKGRFF